MRVKGVKRNPNLTQETNTVTVNEVTTKKKIHNVFLIDASGSMSGIKYANAISGVGELLNGIRKDTDSDNTVTIVEFEEDNIITRVDMSSNIPKSYEGMGTGGQTPLNRALGETIESVLEKRKNNFDESDKILINVFTDGGENFSYGSKYRDPSVLAAFIKEVEAYGVTVTFVGTNLEVQYAINKLNILKSNTLVHNNTGDGVVKAFMSTVRSRQSYSKSVAKGEDVSAGFYTKTAE